MKKLLIGIISSLLLIVDCYVPYKDVLEELGALPYDDPDHIVSRGEMMYTVSNVL